jgi:spore coat-associated protein N
MSRLSYVVKRPKRLLSVGTTILVAAGMTAVSGANFNAQTANPANTFSSGSLSMSNSKDGAAILSASNLRPGGPTTSGTVDIKNTGSLDGDFTLDRGAVTDANATYPLSGKLNLKVVDCGSTASPDCAAGPTVYDGRLSAMGTGIALGNFAADEEHRYEFTVGLDASADDNYQASGDTTAEFVWNATS